MPSDAEVIADVTGSPCRWVSFQAAFRHFTAYEGKTESQQHIKPLHWCVACRLVLEGGFDPDDITPRPPFVVEKKKKAFELRYNPSRATGSERTVLGGLKTKNVDVVVTKNGLGPVMAISCKGTTGAFRNLTNRMEEAVGDCTNLHITYPAMVCGFLAVLRANRQQEEAVAEVGPEGAPPAGKIAATDIAIQKGGAPIEGIIRYHAALRELTARRGIRNDVSRYEAVSLAMVESTPGNAGGVLADFPPPDSPLRFETFFDTLYLRYDERYVYAAPQLKGVTRRYEWSPSSPVFSRDSSEATDYPVLEFVPRLSA